MIRRRKTFKPSETSEEPEPITVKVGSVHVKIHRRKRIKGDASYPVFDVADYSSGTRKLISYANEQEARDKADEIRKALAHREGDVLTLTSADRAAYLRVLELTQPTGVALELAAAQFAEAHQKLAGRSLVEAVNFFVKRPPTALPRKSVQDVFDALLGAKKADGSSAVYLRDLTVRLSRFAKAFHGPAYRCQRGADNGVAAEHQGKSAESEQFPRGGAGALQSCQIGRVSAMDHVDLERVARFKSRRWNGTPTGA